MRRWSKRELAQRAGVSLSSVVRATDPDQRASYDVLAGIAAALRIPPQNLFVKAGLMPREPEQTTEMRHLSFTFEKLPREHQQLIIEFADFLLTRKTTLFDLENSK